MPREAITSMKRGRTPVVSKTPTIMPTAVRPRFVEIMASRGIHIPNNIFAPGRRSV